MLIDMLEEKNILEKKAGDNIWFNPFNAANLSLKGLTDPSTIALATTGLGAIIGLSKGLTGPELTGASKSERLQAGIVSGLKGGLMGLGVGMIPTMLGWKFK